MNVGVAEIAVLLVILVMLIGVPVAVVLVVLAVNRRASQPGARCPLCAEAVQPTARVCKHCGSEITPLGPPPPPS